MKSNQLLGMQEARYLQHVAEIKVFGFGKVCNYSCSLCHIYDEVFRLHKVIACVNTFAKAAA